MPLKSPRYIHVQLPHTYTADGKLAPYGKFRGYSVNFFPLVDTPDMVGYQVAMCSKVDHFCKATARAVCLAAPVKECRVVDFPRVLAEIEHKSMGYNWHPSRADCNEKAWVWKYFL